VSTKNLSWRGSEIKEWISLTFEELFDMPLKVLSLLESARFPAILLEDNVILAEKRGTLEVLQKQGESVFIANNKSNMEEYERSKRDEVTLDEGSKISLGLPILE
jgi:pyruvate/2-oxoacid:ferredoxin oxidoreductase alpha subunit